MTVTRDNQRERRGVTRLARNYGAEFTFRPVSRNEIYYGNNGEALELPSLGGPDPSIRPGDREVGGGA